MNDNKLYTELDDGFIIWHMKMIKELYEGENFLNNIVYNTKIKKSESLILFDKEWLEKWKNIICYEKLKEKCSKCTTIEDFKKEIKEVRDLFIQSNIKQKLDELGMMDCSKLTNISGKNRFIDEKIDFIPYLSHQCAYFMKSIKAPFTINSEISNGIIYIYNPFPEKNKEQKLILLYKESAEGEYFIKLKITLEPEIKIKDIVKEFKKKNIDEILNQKEYKIEVVKSLSEEERKRKEEEERKRKEEEKLKKKNENTKLKKNE